MSCRSDTAFSPLAADRRLDVDALRTIAVLLLILFHTARLFDAEVWHMKDLAAPYWWADLIVRLLNIWQMPLLFLLAGMGAGWALERRRRGAFVAERAARLLVPLAIGMVVFVAPQVWVERISPEVPLRMSPIDSDAGFFVFLTTYHQCCYPAANLSWHHLWFLLYLFVYAAPLALLGRAGRSPRASALLRRAPVLLLLPGVSIFALELALRPFFPSTHDLLNDWANHAHYALLVVFGFWLARNPIAEEAVGSGLVWFGLGAALSTILWLGALSVGVGGLGWFAVAWEVRLAFRIAAEWSTLLALLGLGRLALRRGFAGLGVLAPLMLPFYLVHQTLIVLFGWAALGWSDAPVSKFVVIAGIATLLSLLFAVFASRSRLGRIVVGMPAARRSAGHGAAPPPKEPPDGAKTNA